MSTLFERITSWLTLEPAASLLMVLTAIVLFASAFTRGKGAADRFWPWTRRIIEASIQALLFVGLLWGFRAILNDNANTYFSTHGSLNEASRASAQSIWGKPTIQQELSIHHFHDVEVQREIPREDPSLPPLYRTETETQEILQNSILAFNGRAEMVLSEREKGYALYSGYLVDVQLDYTLVNNSDYVTEAEFSFPLSPGQTLFENFLILLDGQDISPDLRFSTDLVSWTTAMQPHQQSEVSVSYSSRGMDYFYYQIPIQREIRNFIFTLAIDRLPVSRLNYPDGVITPTEIEPTADGLGSILTWQLDRAVTVAGMGVALPAPVQPGARVLQVLVMSPYALSLLGAMLALTFLIWGHPLRFIDLALLSAIYCIQFLTMAGTSDTFFGFWGSLALGAVLTLGLTFLLYHRLPRGLQLLLFLLVGFFTLAYPLSGLITRTGPLNSFNSLVLVGMILYLVGLALYRRERKAD